MRTLKVTFAVVGTLRGTIVIAVAKEAIAIAIEALPLPKKECGEVEPLQELPMKPLPLPLPLPKGDCVAGLPKGEAGAELLPLPLPPPLPAKGEAGAKGDGGAELPLPGARPKEEVHLPQLTALL